MLYVGSAQNIKIPEGRFKLLPGLRISVCLMGSCINHKVQANICINTSVKI